MGAVERGAERLDGATIGVGGGLEVPREGLVVLEREVDDPVGRAGGGTQGLEVVEGAALRLGARRGEGISRGVGAGEPDDLMAGGDELGDDGGADPAGGAGDEDTLEDLQVADRHAAGRVARQADDIWCHHSGVQS